MTLEEFLAQFPGTAGFSRKSLVLLFAYFLRKHKGATEIDTSDVRQCFRSAQRRVPTDLGVLLSSLSRGKASPLLRLRPGVFALSAQGASEVEAILPAAASGTTQLTSFLSAALPHLKKVISKITDSQEREFLAEAVSCIGAPARRATVIMTWVAGVHHLRQHVLNHGLTAFNAALKKRTDKLASLAVSQLEDFDDMNEATFIEVCRSAGLITKDVRKILDEKLGFRNSCAHPASIHVGDAKVVSFVEDIVENVIAKYPTY